MKSITNTLINALTFERGLGIAAAFVVSTSAFALLHAFGGSGYAGQVLMLVGA